MSRTTSTRPPLTPPDGPSPLLLLGGTLGVLAVGVLTVAAGWFTSIGLLLATAALLGVLALVVQRMVQSQRTVYWDTPPGPMQERRGSDSRVVALRHQVELAAKGQQPAVEELHALLTTLAQDRLRDHRGLDLGSPEAGPALGPGLAAYLNQRPGRLTTDELRRHIHTLEELS